MREHKGRAEGGGGEMQETKVVERRKIAHGQKPERKEGGENEGLNGMTLALLILSPSLSLSPLDLA